MPTLIEQINDFAASWAPTMFAIVWQSTLLALVAAALCWTLRRQAPVLRYWIWLAVAAKLVVAPLWTAGVVRPAWLTLDPAPVAQRAVAPPSTLSIPASYQPTAVIASGDRLASPPPTASPPALTWQSWLLLLWVAVIVAEIARTAWQFRCLKRMLAAAQPLDARLTALIAECARRIGLDAVPLGRSIDADSSPMVCGVRRPTLLLPASMMGSFDAIALRQVILHELAHIRRRDLVTVWIIHTMRTLYWFHPVAYWIAHCAGLERELACDQLALIHSGATPAGYARTLICAAGRGVHPVLLSAAAAPSSLEGREPRTLTSPPFVAPR